MSVLIQTDPAFQSTLPVWGGTEAACGHRPQHGHFNPPSPCGEGLHNAGIPLRLVYFNPPSPCGKGLPFDPSTKLELPISIHPPRVGRDRGFPVEEYQTVMISIHPPRVGRDADLGRFTTYDRNFNPPSPCGEGPGGQDLRPVSKAISIHPPRVGRDHGGQCHEMEPCDFNPPSPCGEGLCVYAAVVGLQQFQSTLPVWGGTWVAHTATATGTISIHPPRVGRDPESVPCHRFGPYFNPPSPCGEGPGIGVRIVTGWDYFNPPSPCGEGPANSAASGATTPFQSTLPVWGGTQDAPFFRS